jgi:hypothetical protein
MQKINYRSTNYHDIKVAFKGGYEYFHLECPKEASQTYIDSIKAEFSNLILTNPFYDTNAVSVMLKREVKEVKGKPKLLKVISSISIIQVLKYMSYTVTAMIVLSIIAITITGGWKTTPEPIIALSKSIIVQDHIIPRESYITHTQTETGWYVWVNDINSDFEVYIEVEDYKTFIDEYLTKSKL